MILRITIIVTFIYVFVSIFPCNGWEAKFEYHAFENFEITRKLFNGELKLKENLIQWRNANSFCALELSTMQSTPRMDENGKNKLKSLRDRFSTDRHSIYNKCIQAVLLKKGHDMKTTSDIVTKTYSNYSTHDIVIGAATGFMMLQEAYKLNINMSAEGLISIPLNQANSFTEKRSQGRFTALDFMLIAVYAYKKHWIKNAQIFLDHAEKQFLSENQPNQELENIFYGMFHRMNKLFLEASKKTLEDNEYYILDRELLPYNHKDGKIVCIDA